MRSFLITILLAMTVAIPGATASPKIASPESAGEALFREAKNLRYAQRWYEAARAYRTYLTEYPNAGRAAEARFWLAASLEQDQRWDEASRAYTEFLMQHPDQRLLGKEAKLNRIHCWGMRKGQAPEAIPGLVDALVDPVTEIQVASALQLAQCKDPRAIGALQKGLALPAFSEACRLALISMGVKPTPQANQGSSRFLVIKIKEANKPEVVTIRLALVLAKAVENYLSDAQLKQAKAKGFDLENLTDRASSLPKGSLLLSVDDGKSSVTVNVE